jgi:hypothetical protein
MGFSAVTVERSSSFVVSGSWAMSSSPTLWRPFSFSR